MKDLIKYPLTLLVVVLISAVLLSFLNSSTKKKKESMAREEAVNARLMVLPEAVSFEEKENCVIGLNDKSEPVGFIAVGEDSGYSSKIKVMVGADKEFDIKGVKILYQNETPGLGDKILEVKSTKTWGTVIKGEKEEEKSPWFTEQFVGKVAPFLVKRDGGEIDAITGATISSRAVCVAVNEAIEKIKSCK